MSPRDQAAAIFSCIRGDAAAIKIQRDNFKGLCASITSPNGGFRITSSTVNGQSFGGLNSMTVQEQFQTLKYLMNMLDHDSPGSKKTQGAFY